MFIDEIKVFARAGHGGAGCVAFMREAFRPKGGPSGGDGGSGGDVILEASHDLNNLIAQYYKPRLIAQKGELLMYALVTKITGWQVVREELSRRWQELNRR